jgi:multidrug resistance efflux pump
LAKIRIKHAKAQLEEFHAQQEAARAELLMRESEFKRVEMLKAKNVVGDQAFHEAKSRRASANANVGKASAAVDRAEAEIRSAEFESEEMKLESALRISEATLALLDAQAELARTEHTQRRIRSMRFPGRTRGGREEDDAPTSSSDSSAAPPRR